jgi:DNA-directed RNA polymerase subunit beta
LNADLHSAFLLKLNLKLYCTDPEHEDFDTVIQDVYLGTVPYMTERATFVINGAERVVVSQLHRSPGVFFGQSIHANGTKLYSARIIPFKGSWIEFATDINNVMYAYIDRKKKLPVTTLLRAIGFESDKEILEIFNLAEEHKVSKQISRNWSDANWLPGCLNHGLKILLMKIQVRWFQLKEMR